MTALNIDALMSMLRPTALPGTTPTPQQATGEEDGLFLNLLQSFAETLGGEAETTASTGQPAGDWLATLFKLLAPAGAPNTLPGMPDPTGEATDGEATLSLTEMMAAIQTLTGQAQPDTSASALAQVMQAIAGDTPDVGSALLESIQSGDAEGKKLHNALSTLMQELGMGANPALMAAMLNVQPKSGATATPTAAETPAATGDTALPAATTATPTGTMPTAMSAVAGQTPDTPAVPVAPATGGNAPTEAQQSTTAPASGGTPAFTVPPSAADAARTAQPAAAEGGVQTGQPAPANTSAQTAQVPSSPFQQTLAETSGQQTTPQLTATPSTQTTEAAQPRANEAAPTPQTTDAPAPAVNVAQPATVAPPQTAAAPVADAPPAPTLPDIPALKQLVDSISVLKQNGQTAVRLRLHPASLGQVMVQLQVNDGNVTMQVLTETSKAQALIQNNLPALKAALNAQGLGNGTFDVAVGSDASAFNAPRRQPFQWHNSPTRGRQTSIGVDGIVGDDRPRGSPRSGLSPGRIDYQV